MCQTNREEDKIKCLILCKMKDKEVQRELRREYKQVKDLDDVLKIIKAN